MTLRIGVRIASLVDEVADLVEHAITADGLGFHHYEVGDHVLVTGDTHAHPGERWDWEPDSIWPEPLILLAGVATATTRIRLATAVLIAPLRPAIVLAKMASTLDAMSRGRLDLGLGTGWMREEFEAARVPMAGRTQGLEDTLGACRALWTGRAASFSSDTISFTDMWCQPAPYAPGGPFVFLGGPPIPAAAQRLARFADGWQPMSKHRADIPAGLAQLRSAFAEAGRDPDTIPVRVLAVRAYVGRSAESARELREELDQWAGLGVTEVTLYVPAYADRPADVPAALRWLADVVADHLD